MGELDLLPKSRCQEIFERVRRLSPADEVEILLVAGRQEIGRASCRERV